MAVREAISEIFGSINTTMIKIFYERYAIGIEVVVVAAPIAVSDVGVHGRGPFQYRDFSNTKPP